jgi:hypothetical protein
MNWIFFVQAGFFITGCSLLLGLERGDKVGEVIFNVIGSTPIMAIAIVYLSIWIYAGCVMLKVCPTVQGLGWR